MNNKDTLKLYSQNAISVATFFGGPLAAGFLARQNFISLGKKESAKNSLIIGIVSTVLLFAAIFSVPDELINKVPRFVIPLIYTGIIYILIEKYQGKELKKHLANRGPCYSLWKAVGVGAVSMLVILAGLFSYAFVSPDGFDAEKYDREIAEISRNEENATHLFSNQDSGSTQEIIDHIDRVGIPAWKNNIEKLDSLDKMEGLYDPLKKQNQVFREYTLLRIKSFELIRKAVSENSDQYDIEIEDLNQKIEDQLNTL